MPAPKGARYAAKPDEDRRTASINFRLTPAEHAAITAAAQSAKPKPLTPGDWVRQLALKHSAKAAPSTNSPRPGGQSGILSK